MEKRIADFLDSLWTNLNNNEITAISMAFNAGIKYFEQYPGYDNYISFLKSLKNESEVGIRIPELEKKND